MRVQIQPVGSSLGLHPNEIIVQIQTRDGPTVLIVNKRSIDERNTIEIGQPVGRDGNLYLVELPAETSTGAWRVWVDQLIADKEVEAAE